MGAPRPLPETDGRLVENIVHFARALRKAGQSGLTPKQLADQARAESEAGQLGWFEEPFSRHLPKQGTILEAGCGIGQHVLALRVRGYDAVGVEWAERTVHAARTVAVTFPFMIGRE